MSQIKFVYFDLGKVILNFSHQRMVEQVSSVAGVSIEQTQQHLIDNDLENRYETGMLNSAQFHQQFCQLSGGRCELHEFLTACGDIFWLNESIMPVISQLVQLDIGLGILSNTCQAHWDCAVERFPMIAQLFPVHVKSYDVKSMKPDQQIYSAAIASAKFSAEHIFFVDDKQENVDAAGKSGMQAFLFTDAKQLLIDLSHCGVLCG